MKLLASLLFIGVLTNALQAETAPTAAPVSRYAPLEFMVGGVWIADVTPPGKPATRIELRATWNENSQGIHFHSEFVRGEKRAPYTSGLYAWNGAKQKLVMVYTDMSGSLTEGDLAVEGNVLVHSLASIDPTGKTELIQVRLTKVGPDAFTNDIYVSKNGAWEKIVAVRYERQK